MSKSDVTPSSLGTRSTPLNEARNEMRRLMGILMKTSVAYREREKELARLHAGGGQNYSGSLSTVMRKDLLLADLSGTSKTVATLLAGIGAYITAEIAIKGRVPAENFPEGT